MLGERKFSKRVLPAVLFLLLVTGMPLIANSIFGITFAPVLSSSMEPVIKAGDLEIAQNVFADALKVGDILIFRDDKSQVLISHRITQLDANANLVKIHTKGDNNPTSDNFFVALKADASVPRVIATVPNIGGYIQYLSTRNGKMLSGGILLTSLALFLLRFGSPRSSHTKEIINESFNDRNTQG